MMKKFLCGALAVALAAGTVAVAPAADASAASVPKAKYTFNMNKASKNVVAVARKHDDKSTYKTTIATSKSDGEVPTASAAKKIKLKYTKGKHGKALYLDRSSSYGAQLKNIKLGSGSWTVSFWVKPSSNLSEYMPVFFTGRDITNPKKAIWASITRSGDSWLNGASAPTVWSRNRSISDEHFPWYAYCNSEGAWAGSNDDAKALALKANKWTYVTVVVDTKDTCEYGAKGESGYVKSYHAWTYVNGKYFGNGTIAKNVMSNSNLFFLGINAWDCPFKGVFDDVQLWNKALKAKQVKALYKKMK
jgi:hypothetical protein